MKALLFLAVFALATQVHMSEVTEFYRTFINNIPMDVQSKNQIMNDGLDCINFATNSLINAVMTIQQDTAQKNLVNVLRDVIGSMEVFEKSVLPKCAQTYMELMTYLQQHADFSKIDSMTKIQLLQARLIQLMGKTVLNAVTSHNSTVVATDLAVLVDTAFGLIDANLPTVLEFDYSKFVPLDEQKAVPLFFKGFFTTLGVKDMAKINATSQCVLGVISSIKTLLYNPSLQRGDFYTRAYTFLDSLMPITDAFDKCQRMNTVDMTPMLSKLLSQSLLKTWAQTSMNAVLELPTIMSNELNLSVYLMQGQYELAGQLYGNVVRTVYHGILF